MNKLFGAAILLLTLSIPVLAQVDYGVDVGAAAVTNAPAGTQKSSLHFGGWMNYEGWRMNFDGFYDPSKNNPRRQAFGATSLGYQIVNGDLFKASVGGFGSKLGNEVFGGGELRLTLDNLDLMGRYGSKNFAQGDGTLWIINTKPVGFGFFYNVTRLENFQTIQQGGIRLRLKRGQ